MPTYEYACQTCRKKVSLFFLSIKRAQEETPRCPDCNGEKLGPAGVALHGREVPRNVPG